MNNKHTTQHDLPDDLHETQHTLEMLGVADRARMPDALAQHLAAHAPTAQRSSRVIIGRLGPVLAAAALIALLATSIVFWQRSAPKNADTPDDLVVVMQDTDLFSDEFDHAYDSFYSELVATEQMFKSWDVAGLWDDSSSLWQEVVQ